VVPIYAAGDQDGHLYIAMRYIEGHDLKHVLMDGVLTPARAISICGQVASALDAAHEQGLVHRDVKPSNILLDASDRAYLADFGLSRLSSDAAKPLEVEASLGTIDYVAPEQIRGDPIDGRADVYALGCVLYECFAGSAPFSGRSDVALLYAHLEEEPPAPTKLEDVIGRALAKDPETRYATCGELVEAAAGALGVSHKRRSRWPLVVGSIAASVIIAVAAGPLLRGGATAASGRLIQVEPDTGRVVRTVSIGTQPTGITWSGSLPTEWSLAVGAGGVWAAEYPSDLLWKVDPGSGAVTTTEGFLQPVSLAATQDAVYLAQDGNNGVKVIPTEESQPVAQVRLKDGIPVGPDTLGDATQVATGPGGVWGIAGDTAYRVVPLGGYVEQAVDLVRIPSIENEENVRSRLSGLAVGTNRVWAIGDVGDTRLWRIDTAHRPHVARTTTLGFDPADVAFGFGHLWVTGQITNTLYKIDPATLRVKRAISVGREPMGVTVGAGSVWVANAIDGTISKVDPRTGHATTIAVGGSPTDVTVGDGSVWVAADAS
jgi:YVTN family beta-propeller protein